MIRIETDSGPVDMKYDDDLKMIEFFNDGHLILMRPHQALKVVENLRRLINFHDELGLEQSGMSSRVVYCDEEGNPLGAAIEISSQWSAYRTHREAIEYAHKVKGKDVFTHYRVALRGAVGGEQIYPTGVKAS